MGAVLEKYRIEARTPAGCIFRLGCEMLAILSFALMQTASHSPLPVVNDAPPSMLLAGYNQCMNKEIEIYLSEEIAPEQVFDKSQLECAFWMDAAFAKIASWKSVEDIELQEKKVKFTDAARAATIRLVISKRASPTNLMSDAEAPVK